MLIKSVSHSKGITHVEGENRILTKIFGEAGINL